MIEAFINKTIRYSKQHDCFYHFTDRANIDSIRKAGGILCTKDLRAGGIDIPRPGGNDVSMNADIHFGVDAYVQLCFTTGHPMVSLAKGAGRITDVVWLRIDPAILLIPGVMITDGVANKRDVILKQVDAALSKLDLEVIYTRTNWKDPEINKRLQVADKYEVLVPNIVPLDYIRMSISAEI
jgi:hypothetical protein